MDNTKHWWRNLPEVGSNVDVAIEAAFRNERQDTAPESAWSAFQAVAEVVDHMPRRGHGVLAKAEARFNTCLSGVGQDLKERAFKAACNVAGIAV